MTDDESVGSTGSAGSTGTAGSTGSTERRPLSGTERRWALAGLAVLVVVAVVYLLFASTAGDLDVTAPDAVAAPPLPASRVELLFQPLSVDASNATVDYRVYPTFTGDVGSMFGDTAVAAAPLKLSVDGADPPTRMLEEGDTLGPFLVVAPLDVERPTQDFPFDEYRGQLTVFAARPEGADRSPVPVVIRPDTTGVPGYRFLNTAPAGFSQADGLAAGRWLMDTKIHRAADVKMSTILLSIIMILTAVGALAMSSLVFIGRRKVSTGAFLMYIAIYPFSLIALRTAVPDLPSSGVRFDTIVFLPSVALAFIAVIASIVRWLMTRGAE